MPTFEKSWHWQSVAYKVGELKTISDLPFALLFHYVHYYTTSVKLTHHVNRISEFETWKSYQTHDVNLHEIVATAATSNLAHG